MGNWVRTQRAYYKKSKNKDGLSEEKILLLESLGFKWTFRRRETFESEVRWDIMFEEFERYIKKIVMYGQTVLSRIIMN